MKSKEGNEEKEGPSLLRMNAYRAKRQKMNFWLFGHGFEDGHLSIEYYISFWLVGHRENHAVEVCLSQSMSCAERSAVAAWLLPTYLPMKHASHQGPGSVSSYLSFYYL